MRVRFLRWILALLASASFADDWGMYQIVSASAPELVLEVVGGTTEGDEIAVQKPNGAPNQKWIFNPKRDGLCSIMPASMPALALTVKNSGTKNGSKVKIGRAHV